jgi:hypothetical protein
MSVHLYEADVTAIYIYINATWAARVELANQKKAY